ncbi:MAG: alpha/beta hydrolase-fold protein [Chitinophagaceae bacterium]
MHTVSKNATIIDPAFFMPQLNRTRRLWLYLPEGYTKSKKRYPVLYMHDGQNLFDEATSFSGEWEVDKTLDSLSNACIVIGIDNGGHSRMNEYNINDSEQFGKAEGRLYLEFVVETLKPYIDKNYRTLRSKKNTIMAGSSMGGLISFYAGILYPRVFGGLGIFSPSFWAAPQIEDQIKQSVKRRTHSGQKYYFYGGGAEHHSLINDIQQVAELMHTLARATIEISFNQEGQHSEIYWKREFPEFYKWILR